MAEALSEREMSRVNMVMKLEQEQVLTEIRAAISQMPERQRWQTEVIADIIRTLVVTNKREGTLALALVGAEHCG